MTKAEKTRQFIIEKSAPIFNIKGYENTSMSDVQEQTKLSRGALYGNFSDKNELALACYEYNYTKSLERTKSAMQKYRTAPDRLMAYVDNYAQSWKDVFSRGGCPMLNAAVEADDHLVFLRENVRQSIKGFIYMLEQIIRDGQQQEEFKRKVDAGEYASLIFSIVEGNIMLAKIMNDPKYLEVAAQRVKLIIEQEL